MILSEVVENESGKYVVILAPIQDILSTFVVEKILNSSTLASDIRTVIEALSSYFLSFLLHNP